MMLRSYDRLHHGHYFKHLFEHVLILNVCPRCCDIVTNFNKSVTCESIYLVAPNFVRLVHIYLSLKEFYKTN